MATSGRKWARGVAAAKNRAGSKDSAESRSPARAKNRPAGINPRASTKDRTAARTSVAAIGPALVLLWYVLVHEWFGAAWPAGLVLVLGVAAVLAALVLMWIVSRRALVSTSLLLMAVLASAIFFTGLILEAMGGGTLALLAGIVLWIGVFCVVVARVVAASLRIG